MNLFSRCAVVRGLTVIGVAIALLLPGATTAPAVVTSVSSFKTEIDVRLNITERSIWKGITPGCFAPHENFEMTYKIKIDSRPGNKSKIKAGRASFTGASFGASASYGDKNSFRQFGQPGQWELETQYPADCGDAQAPPVPSWATSPTCKKISERVEASLLQSTENDPSTGQTSDHGALVLIRTPRARPTINGASIGPSCFRTLHEIDPADIDALLAITLKSTLISVPVPNMQTKLKRLERGSRSSRPSFKIPISIGGDCQEMRMRPSNGTREGFVRSSFTQPHEALGSANGDPQQSVCMVSGQGSATVRRVGPVVETLVPLK